MLNGLIQNPLHFLLRGCLYRLVVGKIVLFPLAFWPKSNGLMLFIGRDDGQFIDNVKYFFLYMMKNKPPWLRPVFLTENREVYQNLAERGYPVVYHTSWKSILILLRTKVLVVDNINWIVKFKNQLLRRARKVQLFHAIPIKKIGSFSPVLKRERQYALLRMYQWINGQHQVYDWFLSPSGFFTERVFSRAYPARHIYEGGLPRNDTLYLEENEQVFSGKDGELFKDMKRLRTSGRKTVLYMPTFRDRGKGAFNEGLLDLRRFSEFGRQNGIHFFIKYHQLEKSGLKGDVLENCTHLTVLSTVRDIYPFLTITDLLITDYSSVYFDYLHLDRPVIFFPYDLDEYQKSERGVLFDYTSVTPGPHCFTQVQLEEELLGHLIHQKDTHSGKRRKVLEMAYDRIDGHSCRRIWEDLSPRFFPENSRE